MDFQPLNIIRVGEPRNDGTAGSSLYAFPIQLSRRVSPEEGRVLEELWDRPPSFTTMHHAGIALPAIA